jgi:hypothetical protein
MPSRPISSAGSDAHPGRRSTGPCPRVASTVLGVSEAGTHRRAEHDRLVGCSCSKARRIYPHY